MIIKNQITQIIKLVCVQPQGIGDHVMLLHALESLRDCYPNVILTIVCGNSVAYNITLAWKRPTDNVILLQKKKITSIISSIIKIWRIRPDVAYVVPYTNLIIGQLYLFATLSKVRIGENKTIPIIGFNLHGCGKQLRIHKTYQHIELLKKYFIYLDSKNEIKKLKFAPNYSNQVSNKELSTKRIVGLHPGCDRRSAYKRWPSLRYIELIQKLLNETNCTVALFFGPDDKELVEAFSVVGNTRVFRVLNARIEQVILEIEKLDVFLTSDSGIGHLASSIGVPTITLFGPSDPDVTYPIFYKNNIIQSNNNLECKPCIHTKEFLVCQERRCLTEIPVVNVFQKIINVLNIYKV